MNSICTNCKELMTDPDSLESKIAEIENYCRANGLWVSFDKRVSADTAAFLLDVTSETLRNWRWAKSTIPYYQSGNRGRVTYHIEDIARKILNDKQIVM